MRRQLPLVPIASGLAAATALLAIAVLVALQAGGEARIGPFVLMRIAAGYDRKAAALYEGRNPSKAEARLSAELSRKAIAEYPEDESAWLRLASLDVIQHGTLTSEGVADLRRSYDFVAADPRLGLWRIRFALENSYALPPDVREQVHTEVKAMWTQPNLQDTMAHLPGQMLNQSGAETLALWLIALETGGAD